MIELRLIQALTLRQPRPRHASAPGDVAPATLNYADVPIVLKDDNTTISRDDAALSAGGAGISISNDGPA